MTNELPVLAGLFGAVAIGVLTAGSSAAPAARAGAVRVYVGTYTSGESRGIYRLRLDLGTGALAPEGEPTAAVDPSFLALSPDGRRLYAVNETGRSRGDSGGAVSAFAVDPGTGALTLLNQQPAGGAAPCHLVVDKEGRHLLVANYWGGSVSVFPIGPDGRLGGSTFVVQHEGENPTPRPEPGPHAHSINLDAANRHALVADLGLDALFVYRFDAGKGALTPHLPPSVRLPPGAGPRHLSFHPEGRFAYVINELNSTVTAFAYDAAAGALRELQAVSTLPEGFTGPNSTAEVAVAPNGRFLYSSNRGHDSIAIFALDAATGLLRAAGHQPTLGKRPRHFAIDPTGTYLLAANQESDSVAVFRIDSASGQLQAVGAPVRVPRPVCLRMVAIAG